MPLLQEDRQLQAAFRRGEPQALERVYKHYAGLVYTALKRGFGFSSQGAMMRFHGCRSEHDAEELMQESFRRAFEERARLAYDGIRPYKNYLMMITRNHVIDELRRERARLKATEEVKHQAELSPAPKSPEELAAATELKGLIDSFRQGLSTIELGVFDWRFSQERDQEDAAKQLGLSVYKVRTLERRLRKQLLLHLNRHGYMMSHESAVSGDIQ